MSTPTGTSAAPTISITLAGHPPSPNRLRGHWVTRWRQTAGWRDLMTWLAREQRPARPYARAAVVITFVHARGRLYDPDNATSAAKPLLDALRLGGVLVDDSATHIELTVQQEVGTRRETRVAVTPLAGRATARAQGKQAPHESTASHTARRNRR